MANDLNSILGQAETANEKLAEYFSDLNKFVLDTDGVKLPPDFNLVSDSFDYSELLRMALTRSSDVSTYEAGAAIENINQMAAITREFNMRGKGKIACYADGESDYLNESDYYSTMKVFWVNMLNGIYREGETS